MRVPTLKEVRGFLAEGARRLLGSRSIPQAYLPTGLE